MFTLYNIAFYFILIIIYSFVGWLLEVFVFFVQKHKFINRGFLIGPYCPIYGYSSVIMVLFLHKYLSDPIVLFIIASLICTVIEYITSYLMEKLFNARWWDYSEKKFNVNGRIFLGNSILFGLLGCFLIYIANPFITSLLSKIPEIQLIIIGIVLFIIYLLDNIISCNIISRVKNVSNTVIKDNTEEITEKVKEILRNKSIFTRRLVNAFPDLKTLSKKHIRNAMSKLSKNKS